MKLTADLISFISTCRNVQDHKLVWFSEIQLTHFLGSLSYYAVQKKRGLVIVKTVWSTWKPINFYFSITCMYCFSHCSPANDNLKEKIKRVINVYWYSRRQPRYCIPQFPDQTHPAWTYCNIVVHYITCCVLSSTL